MSSAPTTLEIARIQRAMVELFEAIEADAARKPPGEVALQGVINAVARSQCEAEADKVIRRPVAAACRIALRILGERLFALVGSHERMIEVAERAAEGLNMPRRMAVVSVAWKPIFEATETIPLEELNAENDE